MQTVERCGHWAAEERPAFVAEVVGEFAARGASVPA
jgi:pimeloyl-ACP methyl ester carboxylesterase